MLVVNILAALVTLIFLIHFVACLWYVVACSRHQQCHNLDMKDAIERDDRTLLLILRIMLFRPPDIHVGGLMFYQPFFLFSFFRQLISELAEQNSTIFRHVVGSKCNLKMHVRNLGYPLSLQIGGPKATFLDDFATQRQI